MPIFLRKINFQDQVDFDEIEKVKKELIIETIKIKRSQNKSMNSAM